MKEIALHIQTAPRTSRIRIGDGLLKRAAEEAASILARPRLFLVSDRQVMALHGETLSGSFSSAGVALSLYLAEEGERAKSFQALERLCAALLDDHWARDDCIAILGGGALGDLAGLAASLVGRGCRLLQIPTTLLAQVDSSVGGKTAINTPHGKNLLGTFHQPDLVLIDPSLLQTLDDRAMRCGYAEIVKYGLLGDAAFFLWLEEKGERILAHDAEALLYAIARSCQMKAEIVGKDEREAGQRALLNLGHSFAHALETVSRHAFLHGEAVAVGLVAAARLSASLGLCDDSVSQRAERLLKAAGLPTRIDSLTPPPSAAALLQAMRQDKKRKAGRMRFVLLKEIGSAFLSEAVGEETLPPLLRSLGASEAAA